MNKKIDIPVKYPVVKDPEVLAGTPVIKGTRIPAVLVKELISRGYTLELITKEYPSLSLPKLEAFYLLVFGKKYNASQKTV